MGRPPIGGPGAHLRNQITRTPPPRVKRGAPLPMSSDEGVQRAGSTTTWGITVFRRTTRGAAAAAHVPRDVEALEAVLLALDGGVADAHDARVRSTDAMVRALGLAYGARWVPEPDGRFSLAYETGELVAVMGRAVDGARVLPPDAGLLGAAVTTRRPVAVGPGEEPECLRWRAAQQAGMRAAALVPMLDGGRVVGVMEYYGREAVPSFGSDKWAAIARIASLARKQALAAAQARETLDDQVAVTTVVGRVGAATDEATALRVALDSVRSAFG